MIFTPLICKRIIAYTQQQVCEWWEWIVTQSRIELAAPEGLPHSLLTSRLILIRMYRLKGAGHATGTCAVLLCHWWLIMLSWQGEGSMWGIKGKHKGPLLFMGVTQSDWALILFFGGITAECRLSQQVHVWCFTMGFTPTRQQSPTG